MTLKFTGNKTEVVYSATLNNLAYANLNSILTGCEVSESSTPAMTVDVTSGRVFFGNDEIDIVASADTLTIDLEASSNERVDLILVDNSGVLSVLKGTASAIPATPDYNPEDYIVLAIVHVDSSLTVINDINIRDLRVLNQGGAGGSGGTFGRHVEEFTSQTSVTVTHNLGDDEPNIFVYDSSNQIIIPESVEGIDINSATVTFSTSTTGKIIVYGGTGINNGYYSEDFASATTWEVEHRLDQKYVNVTCYDTSDNIINATNIEMVDSENLTVTFGSATAGKVVVTGGISNENYIQNIPINPQTTNYILTQDDNNSVVKLTGGSNISLTLPDGLTDGFQCAIMNMSAFNVSVLATTTVRSASDKLNLANQYGVMTAIHLGSNEWIIFGELS